MIKFQRYLILATALSMGPALALSMAETHSVTHIKPPSPAPKVEPALTAQKQPKQMSLKDLKENIRGFELELKGKAPNARLQIRGVVFKACAEGKFTIQPRQEHGKAGFTVIDNGLSECMKNHKGEICTTDGCARLSDSSDFSFKIDDHNGDVEIGIIRDNTETDNNQGNIDFDELDPRLSYTSLATWRREHAASLRDDIEQCSKTEEGIPAARDQLERLRVLGGALEEGEFEKISRKLDETEFGFLKERAENAPLDDLDALEEELTDWAADHCKDADFAAPVFRTIAVRHAYPNGTTEPASAEGYQHAAKTIAKAQKIGCFSKTNKTTLAQYKKSILGGYAKTLSQQGLAGNEPFVVTYQYQLMPSLINDLLRACNGPRVMTPEGQKACSGAWTDYRSGVSLWQTAQQVDQQRTQLYQQMMQQMQQQMGQAGGAPTPVTGFPNTSPMQNPTAGGPITGISPMPPIATMSPAVMSATPPTFPASTPAAGLQNGIWAGGYFGQMSGMSGTATPPTFPAH